MALAPYIYLVELPSFLLPTGVYKRLPLLRSDVVEKGTLGRQRTERAAIRTDLGCALPKFTYSLPRHLNSRLVNNDPPLLTYGF